MNMIKKRVGFARKLSTMIALTTVFSVAFGVSTIQAKSAPAAKNGQACTKAELNKVDGSLKCTYLPLSKKYIWVTSLKASIAASTKVDKSKWPKKFIVGAVPSENAASMTLKYKNFVDALSKELGMPVEFYAATDYAGIIEAQVAGRVDLAFYGPFSYVLAKARGAKIDVVGSAVATPTAKPGYFSYGITKSSRADVTKLADFKGKKICFVDPASTSGYLYPNAGLLSVGIDATKENTVFAGGHDSSALSVNRGTCDVGFAYDDMVDTNLIQKGDLRAGDLKVVWKSGEIAGSPMAIRVNMPKSLVDVVKTFVVKKANKTAFVAAGICATEATCQVIEDKSWGFVAYSDKEYDGVRQVCEATKSSKCR
jgi:phosphonate transport system substrate-binding protein